MPATDLPVIPHVPGTTPVGPDGLTPLTPKGPERSKQGLQLHHQFQVIQTRIHQFREGWSKAIISFVDQTDGNKGIDQGC